MLSKEEILQHQMALFNQGKQIRAYEFMGCHLDIEDEKSGYRFNVWAPHAYQVYVQGDFSQWQNLSLNQVSDGLWTLFVEGAKAGQYYKYGIDNGRGHIAYKMDPFGFQFEVAPKDATIIMDLPQYQWQDRQWMRRRKTIDWTQAPIQIYEVHATSWRRHPDGRYYSLTELAQHLIPYVKSMGYTHIELMPLMDHPLEASWGYQVTGYYAVNGRIGDLAELQYFVDQAHQAGLGVLMDWVPGHFCRNENALAYFDGTPTYEYEDLNRANNIGWGTLNFDLGKPQVQSFLISNAIFWLDLCHLDGLRVDAVSNMLYLDFDQGPWTPNEDGSNHNRQGVAFLQMLNQAVQEHVPNALMVAEESTNWQGVTWPVEQGGLGFDFKWNMGWMNDSLKFFEMDPLYRPAHLRLITFVFMYQYQERYILPYSHDEVVHGKKSLLAKIPGDRRTQFDTLRLIHGYMLAQPGKQLHFMGNELGQFLEWRYYSELEWKDLGFEFNQEYQHYMTLLNHIGQTYPAFYEWDHDPKGLVVLDADNLQEAVLTFIRQGKQPRNFVVVACNFTPVQRDPVRIGVPYKGEYDVLLNSAMVEFGGTWTQNLPVLKTEAIPFNGQPYSIQVTLAGLAILMIKPKRIYGVNKQGGDRIG